MENNVGAFVMLILYLHSFAHVDTSCGCETTSRCSNMGRKDFMLAANGLLSGNNYTKIALFFKHMNKMAKDGTKMTKHRPSTT